jgi:hypothetical protein
LLWWDVAGRAVAAGTTVRRRGESEGAGELERLAPNVAGIRRTYWLARALGLTDPAPLLRHLDASKSCWI